jgi:hypothetical protein
VSSGEKCANCANCANCAVTFTASKVTIIHLTESVKCGLQSGTQSCLFVQTPFPETEVCLLNFNGPATSWPSVA